MRNNIWKVQATHPRKKTPKHTKKSENEKKNTCRFVVNIRRIKVKKYMVYIFLVLKKGSIKKQITVSLMTMFEVNIFSLYGHICPR